MYREIAAAVVALASSGCISVQRTTCDANPCGVVWDHGPAMQPRAPIAPDSVQVHFADEGRVQNVRAMGTFRWPLQQSVFGPSRCTPEVVGFLMAKAGNLGFDGIMNVGGSGGGKSGDRQYSLFCVATPYVVESR